MENKVGWGILGAGGIAARFVSDLIKLPDARLVAVGSRSRDRAGEFAVRHGFERAYGSYAELVSDEDVDVVYVATPHPFHLPHTLLSLDHGKAVLCEKPMGVNAGQVRDMVARARTNDLFLMEAMWTRALPVIRRAKKWIEEGRIGEVRMVTADFGFRSGWNPEGRLLNSELAGGALLDVGVYVIAFASMVFGGTPATVQASAHIGETGVDEQTAMVLSYGNGALALLSCAVRTSTPQQARIDGTEGSICIPDFWHATQATLSAHGEDPVEYRADAGYHYEAAEVMSCLLAGRSESALVLLDESIAIAELMDQVRAQIGLVYPMEKS